MHFRKLPGLWLAATGLFLLSFAATSLLAQSVTTGAITGTITDSTGGVIPNASVTATNADTGQVRTGTTNAAGQYQFPLLPPGDYRVKIAATGFKTVEIPRTVNVTETETVDRALDVGAQGQEITIEANVETVQTSSSAMGTVVSNTTATALPLTTRNYTNLVGLSAGANASVNNASGFGAGGVDTAVNGALTSQNNYMMDGVSLSTAEGGSVVPGFYSAIPIPNPDALQEFKIQTSLYDAGYGRNAGGNINVVTKSGTNTFHGSAFEFFRNTDLNATDFFRNRQCGQAPTSSACIGGAKQIFNQNQFGGVAGGPIKKDKLFVFGSYQQTGQKNGSVGQGFLTGVTLAPIPTGPRGTTSINGVNNAAAAAFQAQLGAALCPAASPNAASLTQYETNPGGQGAGAGTQVLCDGSNINPYAMRYLQGTTATGAYNILSSGTSGYVAGLAYTDPAIDHQYQGMLNFDYVLNSKNTITSKYFTSYEPQEINFFGGLPGLPGNTIYGYKSGNLKLTTIVSNTMVNELRGNILRGTNAQTQNSSPGMAATNIYPTCGTAFASQGACAVPGEGILGGNQPLPPQVNITGLFNSYGGTNNVIHNQTTLNFGDQFSWTHGKHTIRFGGEWEDTRWTWVGSWLSHGIMAFQTFDDFLVGLPGACGTASATCNGSNFSNIANTTNFDVDSSSSGIVHGYRMKNANGFVQDDYKVSQRLTLNLGVRWEYDGLLSDKYGNAVNMWPSQIATVPVPATTQVPTVGQPLFPTGGSYAGWVVPSNYSTATYGPLPAGIISSGNLVAVQSGSPKDDFAPRLGFAYQPIQGNTRLVVRGGFGFFFDRIDGNNIVHSIEQSPPYAPTLDQGTSTNQFSSLAAPFENYHIGEFPERWVNLTSQNAANSAQVPFQMSSNITQTSMYQTMQTPLVYEWNFNVQYEFLPRWMLEVGYVGSHGIHQSENLQQLNGANLASTTSPIWGTTENTNNNATLRVPFLGMSPTGMQYATTNGGYKYNGLEVTIRKQLAHGLTFQAAYTWSRAFADFSGSGSNSNNSLDLQQQYGLNTQYRPQRLVLNYQYSLPGAGLKGLAGKALGGWTLAGVTTIQDGFPLIITDSGGGAIYGLQGQSRAQMAPGETYANILAGGPIGQALGGATGGLGYFNPAAFVKLTCSNTTGTPTAASTSCVGATPGVAGTGGTGWGNSGIGAVLGPGQVNFDLTFGKTTRVGGIHENAALQFRAEFFNIFNHANFSNPAANINAGNFGQITSMSVNPRLMQLALKYVF